MASALQVHGGVGFTWEHDLHFFMKAPSSIKSRSVTRRPLARLTELLRSRVEAGESVV
jgi:hypothetical protein